MADEFREGLGPFALASAEDLRHGELEIVIQKQEQHAAEESERRNTTVEKDLCGFRRIGLDEPGVRMRRAPEIRLAAPGECPSRSAEHRGKA